MITTFAATGAASALPAPLPAQDLAVRKRDWEWLKGSWDVWHRRLKARLAGSDDWDEFAGKSVVWLVMGGLGTIDDNVLELPGGIYRATGIRAFDPASGRWAIWWLDGRNPTRIDPPVWGRFEGDEGEFVGEDSFNGRPITVRFRWHEIHSTRPHWDQAFSTDRGATWELNWRNWFTRTGAEPAPLPRVAGAPEDFDFLVGRWEVRHRRQRRRLDGAAGWDEFDGTLENWPVLGGFGNAGDNLMRHPAGDIRGVGLRAFDPAGGEWLSWWLDARRPTVIGAPLRGRFEGGLGTFLGEDMHEGRPIRARVQWSRITGDTARWEQSFSTDGGRTWELNWVSDFQRRA